MRTVFWYDHYTTESTGNVFVLVPCALFRSISKVSNCPRWRGTAIPLTPELKPGRRGVCYNGDHQALQNIHPRARD